MTDIIIQRVQKEKKKFRIYTNKGSYLFSEELIIKYSILKGEVFSEAIFAEIVAEEEVEILYLKTLRYLSYRDRSMREIERYLKKHDASCEVIATIINRLSEFNYLNDERYAQNFLNYTISRKKGPNYLVRNLESKGIGIEIINRYQKDYTFEKEHAIIKEIVPNYIKSRSNQPPQKLRKGLYQKLLRDGFSMTMVSSIINETKFPEVKPQMIIDEIKKVKRQLPPTKRNNENEIIKRMLARGYHYGDVKAAFRNYE